MNKRHILGLAMVLVLLVSTVIIGCAPKPSPTPAPVPAPAPSPTPAPVPAQAKVFKWTVQCEQPPTTLNSIEFKAVFDRIKILSGGRIDATVHFGGEIVPAYSEYEAVDKGVLDSAYVGPGNFVKLVGQVTTLLGASSFPAGPTPAQNSAWFYQGDGLKLANEILGKWAKVVGIQGATGELFCHSNVKLEKAADFKGIKFRTGGSWASILAKYYGASVVTIPGGELYSAIQRGVIDAFEYSSAGTDWPMGFHEVAKYVGIPGIHSPGGVAIILVNNQSWTALPDDLKLLVEDELKVGNFMVLDRFVYQDAVAMKKYREYGTVFVTVSDELQRDIAAKSKEYHREIYDKDPLFKKVWDNLEAFIKVYKAQDMAVPRFSLFD